MYSIARRAIALSLLLTLGLACSMILPAPTGGMAAWMRPHLNSAFSTISAGWLGALLGNAVSGLLALGAAVAHLGAAVAPHHPLASAVLAGAVVVPWLLSRLVAGARHLMPVTKDPQRLFTVEQRQEASRRAGGRCEMEDLLFRRCKRPGSHGDHWYPHSRGGATTMANHVWACSKCNTRKSARIPTFWETTRLEWRRRKYYPSHEPMRPGARL